MSELVRSGVRFERYSELKINFWKTFPVYCEPDLLVRFTGGNNPPLTLLIEVKLNSGKSGTGENDQLVNLQLLHDSLLLPDARGNGLRFVVYLTRALRMPS